MPAKIAEIKLRRKIVSAGNPKPRLHPWIFSGAVESIVGSPLNGDIVGVVDSGNSFLGYGFYSPESKIRIRIFSTEPDLVPVIPFFNSRIDMALAARKSFFAGNPCSDSCRLFFSESDGIPGLVADKFGQYIVLQSLTSGFDRLKKELAEHLMGVSGAISVLERSDCDVRMHEGLQAVTGVLCGSGEIPERIQIHENGLAFLVDLRAGQKTGFFLDQRENRKILATYVRPEMAVLDCFSYTGAFAVNTAAAGAKNITLLDASDSALSVAAENFKVNSLSSINPKMICGDAFRVLREFRDSRRKFDMIILDPPKFATSRSGIEKAMRAYKDINMLAFKLCSPGGIVATFSCSSAVRMEDFRKMLSWAAQDAGKNVQILSLLHQANDHPILLDMPESEYLCGCICRVS